MGLSCLRFVERLISRGLKEDFMNCQHFFPSVIMSPSGEAGLGSCISCGAKPPLKALSINLDQQGQNFASVATVRAALFDTVDETDGMEGWTDEERCLLVDRTIARIAELQNPPHDGINLKRLCSRHAAIAIDPDTKLPCVQCEKERKSV